MDILEEGFLEKLKDLEDISSYKGKILDYFYQMKRINEYSQDLVQFGFLIYSFEKGGILRTEGVERILCCKSEDLNNDIENMYKYVHPEDLDIVQQSSQLTLNGQEYDIDFRIITSEGMVKYISAKSKVILNDKNEPKVAIGVFQDISKY